MRQKHNNRYYHHSTDTDEVCAICNKPFKMYWTDDTEKNGFSDTTTFVDKKKVHYFECAKGKSLHELNEERKKIHHGKLK